MNPPHPVTNSFGVFTAGDPYSENDPTTDIYKVSREYSGKKETAGWIRHTAFTGTINCQITAYLADGELIDRLYEKSEDGHFGYWRASSGSLSEEVKLELKVLLMTRIHAVLAAVDSDEDKRYSTALYGDAGDTDGLQKAIEWIASRYEIAGND